jgi:hypothetical protein
VFCRTISTSECTFNGVYQDTRLTILGPCVPCICCRTVADVTISSSLPCSKQQMTAILRTSGSEIPCLVNMYLVQKRSEKFQKDHPKCSAVSWFVYGTAYWPHSERRRQLKAWEIHRPPSCNRIDRDLRMALGICSPLQWVLCWRRCDPILKCVEAHCRTRSCYAHYISENFLEISVQSICY